MTEILDSHIHLYPPEASADPAGWAEARAEPLWLACVAPKGRRSIQGWADPERLIGDMDRAGLAEAVMLGWYWEREETCEFHNAFYAGLIRRFPSRLRAFAAVQPCAGWPAIDALKRTLDLGFSGIGEILPQAQGFNFENRFWKEIVELAIERSVPITLHVTDPQAGPAAGPETPLDNYLVLARDHPKAIFILAHWGGGLAFGAHPGELPPNLFFDTAASPLMYPASIFMKAVEHVGAERILYGSDYPLLLHPRETREPDFGRFISEIRASGVEEAGLRAILGSNLRKILEKRRASP